MQQQGRRPGKRKQRMKLNLPPKLVEKLVISLCKIFIPSYAFDALLCRKRPFSPVNRLTLRITLMYLGKNISFKKVRTLHTQLGTTMHMCGYQNELVHVNGCHLTKGQQVVKIATPWLAQGSGTQWEKCFLAHPSLVEGLWLLVHWGPFCGVRIRAYHDWWGKGHWTNQGLGFGPRFSPSGHFIISLFDEWGLLVLGTESSPHLRESPCFNFFLKRGHNIAKF